MDSGVIQQIGTPLDIYNEPKNAFVADFIGESNIIEGVMRADFWVEMAGHKFKCLDKGFGVDEQVDVVVRPEDVDVVPVEKGMLTGTVTSVTFKGVHYEIMVETVPGTSVTVDMRVIRTHEVTSENGKEKINASNFYVDLEDVDKLDDKEIIARSNAMAWDPETDEYISIANIEYELKRPKIPLVKSKEKVLKVIKIYLKVFYRLKNNCIQLKRVRIIQRLRH